MRLAVTLALIKGAVFERRDLYSFSLPSTVDQQASTSVEIMFSRIATLSLILVLSLMAIAAPVEVPSVANEVRDDAPPPDPLVSIPL